MSEDKKTTEESLSSDAQSDKGHTPTISYVAEGSPEDYRYVLRQGDLVLIDENNERQIFPFVGNVMSLQGDINLKFADGTTLSSKDIFSRVDLIDMDEFDQDLALWDASVEDKEEGKEVEGNTNDDIGAPDTQAEASAAIADITADLNEDIIEQLENLNTGMSNNLGEVSQDVLLPNTNTGTGSGDYDTPPVEEAPTIDPISIKLHADSDTGTKNDNITSDVTPLFEGKAEPDSDVEIFLGGFSIALVTASSTGSYQYNVDSELAEGVYEVYAVSTLGDLSAESPRFSLVIDTTPPVLPSIELAPESDTGTYADDHYTNDNTPTLEGSGGEAGSTITVYYQLEGSVVVHEIGVSEVADNGTWTFTPTSSLPEGIYDFQITATDASGNINPQIGVLSDVTIDITPPEPPSIIVTDDTENPAIPGSGSDLITADTSPKFSGNTDPSGIVKLYIENVEVGQVVATEDGSWNIDGADLHLDRVSSSGELEEGSYKISAVAIDLAGNTSAPSSFDLVIDTSITDPTINLTGSSDTGSSDYDHITNEEEPEFNGTAEANSTVLLQITNDSNAVVASTTIVTDAVGNWLTSNTGAEAFLPHLTDGEYSVSIIATDVAGNESNEISLFPELQVDLTPPPLPNLDLLTDSGTEGDWITNAGAADTGPLTIGGSISIEDSIEITILDTSNGSSVSYIIPDGVESTSWAFNTATGDWTVNLENYTEGTYQVTAISTDIAGNQSGTASQNLVIDRTIADVSINMNLIDDHGDQEDSELITNVQTPGFSGSADAGATVFVTIYKDGIPVGPSVEATVVEPVNSGGLATWQISNVPELAEGTYTASVTSSDVAGNTNSADLIFEIDTTPPASPTIEIAPDDNTGFPENLEVYTTNEQPLFNGSGAEENARVSVELFKSNGSSLGTTIVRADADGNWDWQYASSLVEGEYTIAAKVIDAAGNESLIATNYSFNIDLTPPPSPTASLSDDTANENIAGTGTDWITYDDIPTFSGTSSSSEIARIRVYINGTLVDEVMPAENGGWTSTPNLDLISSNGALPQGDYEVDIVAVDKAGNESSPFEKTLVIDTQVTPVGVPGLLDDSDSGRYDFDNLTNDKTPILHGNIESGSTAVLRVTGSGFDHSYNVSIDGDGNWQQEVTDEITVSGDYRAVLSIVDIAGNTAESGTFTFEVDLDAPDAPSIDLLAADDSGDDNTDHYTNIDMPRLSGEAEDGAQVSIVVANLTTGSSATYLVDVSLENGVGKWNWQSANSMDDGEYQITATTIDAAGNKSSSVALVPALIIDTEAITPTIDLDSDFGLYDDDNVTNTNKLDANGQIVSSDEPLTFSGNGEIGSIATIILTPASGEPISQTTTIDNLGVWQVDVTGLTETTYNVSVYTTDQAGNVSDTVELDPNLVIDNTPPNAPIITDLAVGEDTGYSADDNITQDRTPIITGTADASARVVLEFYGTDGVTLIKGPVSTYADESGNWIYDSYVADGVSLADNSYKVVAKTIDLAGNTSSGTNSIDLVVDNVAPVAPELILLDDTGNGSDDDPSYSDWITKAEDIRLQGSIDKGETIILNIAGNEYSLDPNQQLTASSPWAFDVENGTWNFTLEEADYPDDSYAVSATRIDAAGNESDSSTRTLVVDRTFDILTIAMDPDDDNGDPDDGELITNASQPSFEGTVSEEAVSVTVVITDSNGNQIGSEYTAIVSEAVNGIKSWSVNNLGVLTGDPSTEYTATVVGVDAASNAKEEEITFTIDTVEPNPTTFAMQDSDDSTRDDITDPDEVYTQALDPTFTGENAESNSRVQLTLSDQDNNEIETVTVRANTSGQWEYTPTNDLNVGNYSLEAVVIDAAGNSSTVTTESFTVDNIKPDPPTGFVLVTDTGDVGDGITSTNPVVISGTSEEYAEIDIYDGATKIATIYADENGAWTTASTDSTGTVLPIVTGLDGDVTYTFSATDKAGNTSVTRSEFTYELDRNIAIESIELAVDSDSGTIGDGITKIAEPNIEIVTEENSTVTVSVYEVVNGVAETSVYKTYSTGLPKSNDDPTLYDIDLAGLLEGNYVVHVDVIDGAGNSHDNYNDGRVPYELTIDTSAPVITTLSDEAGFDLDSSYDSGSKNDGITNNTSPVYTGKTEAGATVYLNIYEGENRLNATPFTGIADDEGVWVISQGSLSLVTGNYSVKAWAVDEAGNSSVVEGTVFDLEIDEGIIDPTIYLPDDQDSADDSDHVTNISNPTFKGWAEIGADLELIFSKSGSAAVTVSLQASNQDENTGNWEYTASSGDLGFLWDTSADGLLDGSYNVSIRSTDAAGNSATTILNPKLEIDTEVPDTPTAEIVDTGSQQTEASPPETIVTSNGNLSGSYDSTDAEKILIYLDYSNASDAVNTAYEASLNSDGTWTLAANVFSPISEGSHTYRIVALDGAGNESDPVVIDFIYDTVNPSFEAELEVQDNDGGSGSNELINGSSPAEIGGDSEAGLQITITVNGTATYQLPDLTTGTSWDFTFDPTDDDSSNDTTISLEQGDNKIEITAEDKAGNTTTKVINVELDNEIPDTPTDIDLAEIDDVNYDSKDEDDDYTNADVIYLQGKTEPGTEIQITLGSSVYGATVDEFGNWISEKIPSTGSLPHSGTGSTTYDFSVIAVDDAGNESVPVSYPIEIDRETITPVVVNLEVDDVEYIADENGEVRISSNVVTLNGTAEKNSDIIIVVTRPDNSSFEVTTTTNENGEWTASTALKSATSGDGSYTIDVTANDKAGNDSEPSEPFAINLDTTIEAPTIALEEDTEGTLGNTEDDRIGSDSDLNTKPNADGNIVLIGETDADTASMQLFIGSEQIDLGDDENSQIVITPATSEGEKATWRFEYTLPDDLEAGSYPFKIVAKDTAGNESFATETIFIDNQVPDAPSFTALVDDTDTGNITTDEYTKLDTFTLSGTATENGEDVAVHIYYLDADGDKVYVGRAEMEDNSTSWTFSYTTEVNGGDVYAVDEDRAEVSQYKFVAVAEDKAGNQSDDSSDIDVQVDRSTDIPTIDLHEDSDSTGQPVDGVAGTNEDNLTNENTLKLNGGGAEPGAKIVLLQKGTDDDGTLLAGYETTADAIGNWTISVDVGTYDDGIYYFYARAIDKAGNESDNEFDNGSIDFTTDLDSRIAAGEVVRIEIDHTDPWASDVSLTISVDGVDGTDTGRSDSDGITFEHDIILTGSLKQEDVDRGLVVRVYKAGSPNTLLGTAKIIDGADGADATWDTSELNLNYTAGDYQFYIEVEDLAGNVTTSDKFDVTIDDTNDGTTPYLDISTNTHGNIGTDSDWLTSSDTFIIKGSAEFSSYVYLTKDDGTTLVGDYGESTYVVADPNTGAWSIEIDASDYEDGSYTFWAYTTDIAGNLSRDSFVVSVDRTAPTATTVSLASGSDTGEYSDDDITFGNTISSIEDKDAISLTGTLASVDAGANVVAVYIYQEIADSSDILIGEATVDGNTWTHNFAPAENGVYTYYARVEDNAGNVIDSDTVDITIDRTAPTTSLLLDAGSDTFDTEAGGTATDKYTGADDLDLTVSLDATDTDIAEIEIFRKDGDDYTSLGTATAPSTDEPNWVFTVLKAQIPDNQDYTFVARATDTAGNVEDIDAGLTVTIDRIDPIFDDIDLLATDDSQDSLGLGSDDDDYTNDTTLNLTGTVESDGSIDIYITEPGGTEKLLTTIYEGAATQTNWTFDNTSGVWTYDYEVSGQNGVVSPADYVFRAVAFDKAGNSTEQDITITVDRDMPDATVISLQQEGDDVPTSSDDYHAIVNYDDVTLTGTVTESSADIVVAIYTVGADGNKDSKIASSVLDANGDGFDDIGIGEVIFTDVGDGTYTWTYTSTDIADGAHSFMAVVEDKAGNSVDSAPYNLFVDNVIEVPTIALDDASNSYWVGDSDDDNATLGSNSDLITNETTITLTGTSDTDSRIDVYIDGEIDAIFSIDPVTNAVPDQDGSSNRTWSQEIDISSYLDSTLSLENLTFTAVATDYAGNEASSTDTTITFDRQNVVLTVDLLSSTDPDSDHDSAGFTGDHDDKITNATEITLTGTADANCHITILNSSGDAIARADADDGGDWTISEIWNGTAWVADTTIDTTNESGVVSYTVRSVDEAGNSKTETIDITFDHEDPALATIALSEATNTGDDSTVADGGLTNLEQIVLEGLIDGSLAATSTPEDVGLEIYLIEVDEHGAITSKTLIGDNYDLGLVQLDIADNSWSLAYTLPVGTDDTGNFTFMTRTVDLAGNQTTSDYYPVEYDNDLTIPTIDLVATSDTFATTGTGAVFGDDHDENTKGQGETNTLSFDIDTSADNIVELYLATVDENGNVTLEGDPLVTGAAGNFDSESNLWTLSYTPTSATAVDYVFVAQVEDAAGNIKLSEPLPVHFDPFISQVTIGLDLEDGTVKTIEVDDSSADYRSSDTSLTLSGTVEAGALVEIFRNDVLIYTVPATGTVNGSWTTDISFADGDDSDSYTFTAVAYDLAGNSSSKDLVIIYDKDTLDTAPTIAININSNTGETSEDDEPGTSDKPIITGGTKDSNGTITEEVISLEGSFSASYTEDDFAADPLTAELYDGTTKVDTSVVVSYDSINGHYIWAATDVTAEEGLHNYHLVVTDSVGNTTSSGDLHVLVDIGFDPSATIELDSADDTSGDYYGADNDAYTSNHEFDIGGAGEAGSSVVVSVTLVDDSGNRGATYELGSTTVSENNTWNYSVASNYVSDSSGSYVFTATLTDRAENVESVELELIVDKESPEFGTVPIQLTTDSGTVDDQITNAGNAKNGDLTLSGDLAGISSGTDFEADDIVVYLLREGADAVQASVSADGTWSYSYSSIDQGTYNFRVVLEDKAGNSTTYPAADDAPYTVVVDRQISVPTVSLDVSSDTYGGPAEDETDGGIGDNYTAMPEADGGGNRYINLAVSGDTDSIITVYLGSDDTGTLVGTSTYDSDTNSWPLVQFDASSYSGATTDLTFVVVAEDGANEATSNSYTFTLDDQAPEIPATNPIDLTNSSDFGLDSNDSSTISNSDDLTNGQTITLEGVLYEGADDLQVVVTDVLNDINNTTTTTTYEAVVTGDANSGYKWSLVLGNTNTEADYVSEGTHTFTAVIEDNAGNQTEIGPLEVVVDRTAPALLSIAMDDSDGFDENPVTEGEETIIHTNNDSPTFTITNLELGSTLLIGGVIVVDEVTADMVTNGYEYDPTGSGAYSLGEHTINITARDQAGNESATTTMTFVVDDVAEDITNVKLTDDTDTGSSDSDNITYNTTPSLQGNAEEFAEITIEVKNSSDGVVSTVSTTADSAGAWSTALLDEGYFSEGEYTVKIVATDLAGNVTTYDYADDSDPDFEPVSFTVDTDIENTSFSMEESEANDTGFELDDKYTNNKTPTFTWTPKEDGLIPVITLTESGGDVRTYSTPVLVTNADDSISWTTPNELPDGIYVASITYTDTAGNTTVDTPETVNFEIDTSKPSLTGVNLTDSSDAGTDDDWHTNLTKRDDTGITIEGNAEAGSRIYVNVNGVSIDTIAGDNAYLEVGADGAWTYNLFSTDSNGDISYPETLDAGDNTIEIIAVDKAGNETSVTKTLNIDIEVDPVGTIELNDASNSGSELDNITNNTTPTLTGKTEAGSTVKLYLGEASEDNLIGIDTARSNGVWSITVPDDDALTGNPSTTHSFTAVIVDTAENEASVSADIIVDTVPPVQADLTCVLATSSDTGKVTDDEYTNDNTPTFEGSGTEVETTVNVYIIDTDNSDDEILLGTVTSSNTGSWSFDFPTLTSNLGYNGIIFSDGKYVLDDGDHTIAIRNYDVADNESDLSALLPITIDTVGNEPTIGLTDNAENDTGDRGDMITKNLKPELTIEFEVGSYDAEVKYYKIDSDGNIATDESFSDTATSVDEYGKWIVNHPGGLTELENGRYSIVATAYDKAGNIQTETTVLTTDGILPAFEFEIAEDQADVTSHGIYVDDNIFDAATVTINITGGEVDSKISILNKSGTVFMANAGTVDGNGELIVDLASNIANNSSTDFEYIIRATDAAGNVVDKELNYTVDRVDPTAAKINLQDGSDTDGDFANFGSKSDDITSDTTPQIDIEVEDDTQIAIYRQNPDGSEELIGVATPKNGAEGYDYFSDAETPPTSATQAELGLTVDGSTFTYQSTELGDGDYIFKIIATDLAGNSKTSTLPITIDSEYNPSLSVELSDESDNGAFGIVVDDSSEDNLYKNDDLTNDETPLLKGAGEIGSTIKVYVGGRTASPTEAENTNFDTIDAQTQFISSNATWAYNANLVSDAVKDGYYRVMVVSQDIAGNESVSYTTIQLDTTSPQDPTIQFSADPSLTNDELYVSEEMTKDSTPYLTGTAEAGTRVVITLEHNLSELSKTIVIEPEDVVVVSGVNGEWSYQIPDVDILPNGPYTATVTSTDQAGNVSLESVGLYVSAGDPEVPTIGLVAEDDTHVQLDGITSKTVLANDDNTGDDEITITGYAEANTEIKIYRVPVDGTVPVVPTPLNDEDGNPLPAGEGGTLTNDQLNALPEASAILTTAANGSWSWNIEDSGQPDDGEYTYYAVSEYFDGKNYMSEVFTVIVDSAIAAPTVELGTDSAQDNRSMDTGLSDEWFLEGEVNNTGTDWRTQYSSPKITGVVEGESSVAIYIGQTDDDGNWLDVDGNVTQVAAEQAFYEPVPATVEEGAADSNVGWSYTFTSLDNGSYNVKVVVTDRAGNTAESDIKTITVDSMLSAPTVDLSSDDDSSVQNINNVSFEDLSATDTTLLLGSTIATVADLKATGFTSSVEDGYTSENILTLEGTTDLDTRMTINCFTSEGEYYKTGVFVIVGAGTYADPKEGSTGSLVVAADGSWTYETGELADGSYSFEVTSVDLAGNSKTTPYLNVNIDTSERPASVDLQESSDTGPFGNTAYVKYNTDNVTKDDTPTFTLYGDNDSTYLLYLFDENDNPVTTGADGSSIGSPISGTISGTFATLELPSLADGDYTVKLVTANSSGRVTESDFTSFTIDTTTSVLVDLPDTEPANDQNIPVVISGDYREGTVNDFYTNDNTPSIDVYVDPGTMISFGGAGLSTSYYTDSDNDGIITINPGELFDGNYDITIKYGDLAGNVIQENGADLEHTFTMTVDTTDPGCSIDLTEESDLGFNNDDNSTSSGNITLVGALTPDVEEYTLTITNRDTGVVQTFTQDSTELIFTAGAAPAVDNSSVEITFGDGSDLDALDDGDYSVIFSATDKAGNTHSTTLYTTTSQGENIARDHLNIDTTPIQPLVGAFTYISQFGLTGISGNSGVTITSGENPTEDSPAQGTFIFYNNAGDEVGRETVASTISNGSSDGQITIWFSQDLKDSDPVLVVFSIQDDPGNISSYYEIDLTGNGNTSITSTIIPEPEIESYSVNAATASEPEVESLVVEAESEKEDSQETSESTIALSAESDADADDIADTANPTFAGVIDTVDDAEATKVELTLTGDTNKDGIDDVTITETVELAEDDSWSYSFASDLTEGDYSLNYTALNDANEEIAVNGSDEYDFTVLASEFTTDNTEIFTSSETDSDAVTDGQTSEESVSAIASVDTTLVENAVEHTVI